MKKMTSNAIAIMLLASLSTFSNAAVPDSSPVAHSGHQHGANEQSASLVGKAGDPKKVTRTVTVDMNDSMRFSPASIAVKRGEIIRFVVNNSGKIKHEMVIGSESELKEHAQQMAKFPEMEHAEPNQVTVTPGKSGTIVWQFDKAGKVEFACLQPGHFEAGMKGQVVVSAK